MFLAITIGNSATKFGVFEGTELIGRYTLSSLSFTGVEQCWLEIHERLGGDSINPAGIAKVGLASVVPNLTDVYSEFCKRYLALEPGILSARSALGFKVKYRDPDQVGADRLANVAAARAIYGYPAVVVDLGTATTFDVIDDAGDFVGGIIAPGVGIAAVSLFERAARLFPVDPEPPQSLIAQDTANAMKSGIYYGHIGQIEYLLGKIKAELGYADMEVIATGGFAELLSPETSMMKYVSRELALKGLQIIFDR
jgi:type III pantothenate kinase